MAFRSKNDDAEKLQLAEQGAYSMAQLATMLGCSLQHIRNMAAIGSIPGFFRFGNLVRFNRTTINNWLEAQGNGGQARE